MAGELLDYLFTRLRDAAGEPAPADGALLERFQASRDGLAFAELVRRHGGMVLGVARAILGNVHDAEDAFQATFLVLARRAAAVRHLHSVGGWLCGIARRVALDARRRAARRRRLETEVETVSEPGDQAARDDLRPVLAEELGRLPEKYRLPLVLCYFEGKTSEQAAALLRCPAGTLRSNLSRGRDVLRGRLARRGLALSSVAVVAALEGGDLLASVPPDLAGATVRAALVFAEGGVATGLVSAGGLSLVHGTLRRFALARLKTVAAAVLALGLVGSGLGWAFHGRLLPAPDGAAQVEAEPQVGAVVQQPLAARPPMTKPAPAAEQVAPPASLPEALTELPALIEDVADLKIELRKGDRILFLGDSLTVQAGRDEPKGIVKRGYVGSVRQQLQQKYPDLKLEVDWVASDGHAVADLLKRLDTCVFPKRPTIVVVQIGCNDARRSSMQVFTTGLEDLTRRLRQAGIQVVLCTPTSIGERQDPASKEDVQLEALAEVARTVARTSRTPLADLRAAFIEHWRLNNPTKQYSGVLTHDGTHLNQRGNDFLAERLLAKFK